MNNGHDEEDDHWSKRGLLKDLMFEVLALFIFSLVIGIGSAGVIILLNVLFSQC